MTRTLLLCFLHGFKGDDDTFRNFPADLKRLVSNNLPDDRVESIVYPKYETKGELGQCSEAFLSWLKEKVMDARKVQSKQPWPPHDRDVGVILVAHSMGGFVASDTLLLILNERLANEGEVTPMFPLIHGILTFDTPFNGLARSMFVYGAFSNYQKVSSVFNVMTALSAAPSALGTSTFKRAAASAPGTKSSNPAWKGWQLIAVRTGTVGAIAAGGVAAYVHRQKIMDGMRSMRNLNAGSMKEGVKEGYQQSIDTLSQGLAYVNRGNVGRSFEYLSDHFTFVGALMKQQELSRRLERMAALKGIGIHDFYTSLGENGMWSGGYFVPERTFCAVPEPDHPAHSLFSRQVIREIEDEIQAHMSMFAPEKNKCYGQMAEEASSLVTRWFNDDTEIFDDPKFTAPPPPEPIEEPVATTEDGKEVPKTEGVVPEADGEADSLADEKHDDGQFPDESPMDIAAAASLVPLPDDADDAPDVTNADGKQQATYLRYLMGVASQAGTGVKSYVPRKMPDMPQMPSGPSFKSFIPTQIPQMPTIPRPNVGMFGKKQQPASAETSQAETLASDAAPEPSTEPSTENAVHQDPEVTAPPALAAAK